MNRPLIDLLQEIRQLMELKGENPFKIRAFDKAAATIESMGEGEDWVARAREGTFTEIPGIGKGIAQVLSEFLLEGKSSARDELEKGLPEGLRELTSVPGLGPKKAMQLIEELGIRSLAELEYACRENRLNGLKGFGPKVQQKIQEGVAFATQNRGFQRLDQAFKMAESVLPVLLKAVNGQGPQGKGLRITETGALRRRCEVLSELEFLVEVPEVSRSEVEAKLYAALAQSAVEQDQSFLPVKFYFAAPQRFGSELVRTTGTEAHFKALGVSPDAIAAHATEEEFYSSLGLPFISAEMRETGAEVALARTGELLQVLPWDGIRGVFHNHTNRSDGAATLEQMVKGAVERGLEYIGISDHSQSAFYAQGLKEEALLEQESEIRELQNKFPQIRIFWGVESDILADGALDYSPELLKRMDFVVGSIHSRFQMDRETMTQRILEAVRNPYITMIGHVTGRILLGRKGYDLDLEKIIAECAKRKVVMEINAHPARLDIDWRWGETLRAKGCLVSVNPDAHEVGGLDDVRYGVAVARKALLPSSAVLNSRKVDEVSAWLRERR